MAETYSKEQFQAIYDRQIDTVYRICFLYTKNRHDAEDMVQTTFLKMLSMKQPFQNSQHEKAWLIVTASNVCKDFLKHWWRRTSPIEETFEKPADTGDGDILVEILKLPEQYRSVIYLYYFEGYSTVELAKMLKKKESTIRGYLFTGRKLLKKALGGNIDE